MDKVITDLAKLNTVGNASFTPDKSLIDIVIRCCKTFNNRTDLYRYLQANFRDKYYINNILALYTAIKEKREKTLDHLQVYLDVMRDV